MPIESGFHSLVRFRNKDGHDCAYHHYNGKVLHQGCCELEIHRENDVITWNAQRIAKIKAAYVDSGSPVMASKDHLAEEKLKNDDVLSRAEELIEIMINDEPKGEKESLDLVAPQVFGEKPDLENCIEHKPRVALFKEIDVVNKDEFDPKPPMLMLTQKQDKLEVVDEHKEDNMSVSSDEDQENLKVRLVDESKDMTPCFNPGGEKVLLGPDYYDSQCTNMKPSDKAVVIKSNLLITHGENNVSVENLDELKVRFATPWAVWLEDGVIEEVKKLSQHLSTKLQSSELLISTVKSASIQAAKDPCLAKVIFDPGIGSVILVDSLQENGSLWSIDEAMTEVTRSLKVIESDKENGNYNEFFELLDHLISLVDRASLHLDHLMKNIALDDSQSRVEMLALLLGRNFDPGGVSEIRNFEVNKSYKDYESGIDAYLAETFLLSPKSFIDVIASDEMVFDPGGGGLKYATRIIVIMPENSKNLRIYLLSLHVVNYDENEELLEFVKYSHFDFQQLAFNPNIIFNEEWAIETEITLMLCVAPGSWKYPHFVEAQLAGSTKSFWAICLIRKTCVVMPFDPGGQLTNVAENFQRYFTFLMRNNILLWLIHLRLLISIHILRYCLLTLKETKGLCLINFVGLISKKIKDLFKFLQADVNDEKQIFLASGCYVFKMISLLPAQSGKFPILKVVNLAHHGSEVEILEAISSRVCLIMVILAFDPGREGSSNHGIAQLARSLAILNSMKPVLLYCHAIKSASKTSREHFCLILEDKDHLEKGDLLQENGVRSNLKYFVNRFNRFSVFVAQFSILFIAHFLMYPTDGIRTRSEPGLCDTESPTTLASPLARGPA